MRSVSAAVAAASPAVKPFPGAYLKDDVDPVLRNAGILRMECRDFARKCGLGLAAEHAGLCCYSIERHRMDPRNKAAETNIDAAIDG